MTRPGSRLTTFEPFQLMPALHEEIDIGLNHPDHTIFAVEAGPSVEEPAIVLNPSIRWLSSQAQL